MNRILVFGNSGAGKSTLAKRLSELDCRAHLDLDSLAWLETVPPQRAPIEDSKTLLDAFTAEHNHWVIEGCYTDLLELLAEQADAIIFLDLPVADCQMNAKARPWEPHKYESKSAQDANLDMLLEWISAYEARTDTFSRAAHQKFYSQFSGQKWRLQNNDAQQTLTEFLLNL